MIDGFCLATLVGSLVGSLISARNTNKITTTQLKLAYLNIQAQRNLEENRQHLQVDLETSRQQFQERMSSLGFSQQRTLREFDQQFQLQLRELDHQHQQVVEEFRATVNEAINQKNLDFQAWKFEREMALQKEMVLFNRETQLTVAAYQRETALQLPEINKIYENWPLKLVPSQILNSHPNHLRIFISPPELDYDRFPHLTDPKGHGFPRVENFLGTRLLKLLNQYYPRNDELRPTQLLDGAWDSKRFAGSSSIVALADRLESEPLMVLETQVVLNKYLNLKVAYKGIGQKSYLYQDVISRFEYSDILFAAARARMGENAPAEKIQVMPDDWEILYETLEVAHCIVATWMADVHHLIYHHTSPLLPQLLPGLVKELPNFLLTDADSVLVSLMQEVVKGYQTVFQQLEKTERCYQVPELFLDLAQGLANFGDQSIAGAQVKESIVAFLRTRNHTDLQVIKDHKKLKGILISSDKIYLEKLEKLVSLFGEELVPPEVSTLLRIWGELTESTLIMENRLAVHMLDKAELIKEDTPSIYRLSLDEDLTDNKQRLAKRHIGKRDINQPVERVIMVLGAAGAGKTTLINGMINYILGVKWEDNFRFQLITEEVKLSQAHSQTQFITAYTIYKMEGSTLAYNLTIIDTPGFGATEGLQRDKLITEQIRKFFSMPDGVKHLDGIGFVTQSSLARLTPSQKYVFDAILSIFGKDIADNIFMMITFCDGQKPPVIEAVRAANIPYIKFFKFNNSALFANNVAGSNEVAEDDENFDKMFWKMGIKSFKTFFAEFEKAESRSLQLTKEVLQKRKHLETTILGLEPRINDGLSKLDELRQVEIIIQQRGQEIEHNKNFQFKVIVPKQRRVNAPNGKYNTTCLQCHVTCHEHCAYARDDEKKNCSAMKSDGYCSICGCHWTKHSNTPYVFEAYNEVETRTSGDLLQKYNTAVEGMNKAQSMLSNLKMEFENATRDVFLMVVQVQRSLRRLDEIALKPDPVTSVEYLDLLIESEKRDKKEGWQQRVMSYEDFKKQAKLLDVDNNEDVQKILSVRHDFKNGIQGNKSKTDTTTISGLPKIPLKQGLSSNVYQNDHYQWTSQYDAFGNEIERLYFDINGQSVLHQDNYHQWKAQYDAYGNQIEVSYFDVSGQPILHRNGYHQWKAQYDVYGNQVRVFYFNVDGQPISYQQ